MYYRNFLQYKKYLDLLKRKEYPVEMQDLNLSKIVTLPNQDKQKLVMVFTWLLEEDKKQNPALYQLNKK